ncbi:MAG: c-type heme family protein [Actinomycetota bacterium]
MQLINNPAQRRQRAAVLAALTLALAASALHAVTVSAAPKPAAPAKAVAVTLPEGRRQVRMMAEIYNAAVVSTHKMYVQDPGTPAAVIWAKQVIKQLEGRGWPEARLFATHDRPLNPENAMSDDFERSAAAAFKMGKTSFEQVKGGELRYATDIRLIDQKCIMCHVRNKEGDLVGGVSYRIKVLPTGK